MGEPVEVTDEPVRAHAGIEQDAPHPAVHPQFDEGREPMLGAQVVGCLAAVGHLGRYDRDLAGRADGAPSAHQALVGQQGVTRVVDQCGDVHSVDWFEWDRLHPVRIVEQHTTQG
jgi:hypothetical protein